MLNDIVYSLLNNTVDVNLFFLREYTIHRVNIRCKRDFTQFRHFPNDGVDACRQSKFVEMIWPKIMRNLADFRDCLCGDRRDVVEPVKNLTFLGRSIDCQERTVFDHKQVLSQTIVEFSSDARPLVLLRFDQSSREFLLQGPARLEASNFSADCTVEQRNNAAEHQNQKP